jgi:hypothetical protein
MPTMEEDMSVVLSQNQLSLFAARLAEQAASANQPKVCLVADSPNLARRVEDKYGKNARPNLQAVLRIARRYGQVHEATLVANPGLPRPIAVEFNRAGFNVDLGLAPDCDDRVIRKCVEAGLVADVLICMGGDHAFVDIVRLIKLQKRPVKVVIIAVKQGTAACLLESCDAFIELPVFPCATAA